MYLLKHDLLPEDYDEYSEVFDILGVKIPEHKNLFKYSVKNQKQQQVETRQVEWVPPIQSTGNDPEKITQLYFEDLGMEKIPFKNSEASKTRKELVSMQVDIRYFFQSLVL